MAILQYQLIQILSSGAKYIPATYIIIIIIIIVIVIIIIIVIIYLLDI